MRSLVFGIATDLKPSGKRNQVGMLAQEARIVVHILRGHAISLNETRSREDSPELIKAWDTQHQRESPFPVSLKDLGRSSRRIQ